MHAVSRSFASVLLFTACTSAPPSWSPTPLDLGAGQAAEQAELELARARMDEERYDAAWTRLAPIVAAHPDDLDLGAWFQDLRLELLRTRSSVDPELEPWSGVATAEEGLRKMYAARAEAQPEAARLILAARAETDAIAALELLDRALARAPSEAWAHYGKAHALLRQRSLARRWELARSSLRRALALDPGHLRARRLQAWMFAQEGTIPRARSALEVWLRQTRNDPRVGRGERREAEIDLALVMVLDGQPKSARRILAELEGSRVHRDRRLAILAVAESAMGDLSAALDTARRAASANPAEVLPVVQQALILQYWLDDRAAADVLWREVIDRARRAPELGTLLQGFRAQAMLEENAREATAEGSSEDLEPSSQDSPR
jgi:Tfp pilus assembly protein PilF